jgi:hypothetical protein
MIEGEARRLLALRGYLRGGRDLAARWAWSREEIDNYKDSADYKAALVEVEKVRVKFAELNPGYDLQVKTEVRSLEEQVRKWNEAESVGGAGEELLTASLREVTAPGYKDPPDEAVLDKFGQFLRGYRLENVPTVAVPGLSPHGQLRAFDFQVRQGGKVVAGTSAAAVKQEWETPGWTDKLNEAVAKSGARFSGPLESPREPWHYTYAP